MMRVTITETYSAGRQWVANTNTDDEHDAIARAITHHWGPKAGWQRDAGLANIGRYGQIIIPVSPGYYNCLTDTVRIDVDPI